MNKNAHNIIFQHGVAALPRDMRKIFEPYPELLDMVGNYPDFFDDPSKTDAERCGIDPQWSKYCIFPDTLAGRTMHSWPDSFAQQLERQPLSRYYFEQMIGNYKNECYADFIKFAGCFSHLLGDTFQPAHLAADTALHDIMELVPRPDKEQFKRFHYHTDIESVTGRCAELEAPELLGLSLSEATWRLAKRCAAARTYCRRFIIPIVQALFAGDEDAAIANASEPVTIAAQMTGNVIFTAIKIAANSFSPAEIEQLKSLDLRFLPADKAFHDSVYAEAILDGNMDAIAPGAKPVLPAKLNFADGPRQVKGLGVLPHSGMSRSRDCYMTWILPRGIFKQFSAKVGLHADLAVGGAVSFQVLLDDETVWDSGRMTRETLAKALTVPLGGAETLTLKVCDANDGQSFLRNHSIWADPVIAK